MKSNTQPTELLINASVVTASDCAQIYEFVLNHHLEVTECLRVESLVEGIVFPVDNFRQTLNGVLFELNHVRVNPRLDNEAILTKLTEALVDIGVGVHNAPSQNDLQMCYRPLGEISENVRFYFNTQGPCVFLCPKARLRAVSNSNFIEQQLESQESAKPTFRPKR